MMAKLVCVLLSVFCALRVWRAAAQSSCDEEEEARLRLSPTLNLRSPDGNVGRLEICLGGAWGTFTLGTQLDFWSEKNVQMACRELGFSGGLNSIPPSHIPAEDKVATDLAVHYGALACTGAEDSVTSCLRVTTMADTTSALPLNHSNDVFIVCLPQNFAYSDVHVAGQQVGDVRLFGQLQNGEGAVEIFTDQLGWTAICPEAWDNSHARAVCQALGYDAGRTETFEVNTTDTLSPVRRLVRDATCSSSGYQDSSPSHVDAKFCSFQRITGDAPCTQPPNTYAGVLCESAEESVLEPIRFFGKGIFDSTRAVGVVEIYQDGKWGMVCQNKPDDVAQDTANSLCRRFFPSVDINAKSVRLPVESLQRYQSRLKPLWAKGILCPSNGSRCPVVEEPLGFSNCSSQHVLALDCGTTETRRENNSTAIIVGVGIMVFVFVLVFFVFGKVLYGMWRKRRRVTMITTGSLSLSGDLRLPPHPHRHHAHSHAHNMESVPTASNDSCGEFKEAEKEEEAAAQGSAVGDSSVCTSEEKLTKA